MFKELLSISICFITLMSTTAHSHCVAFLFAQETVALLSIGSVTVVGFSTAEGPGHEFHYIISEGRDQVRNNTWLKLNREKSKDDKNCYYHVCDQTSENNIIGEVCLHHDR